MTELISVGLVYALISSLVLIYLCLLDYYITQKALIYRLLLLLITAVAWPIIGIYLLVKVLFTPCGHYKALGDNREVLKAIAKKQGFDNNWRMAGLHINGRSRSAYVCFNYKDTRRFKNFNFSYYDNEAFMVGKLEYIVLPLGETHYYVIKNSKLNKVDLENPNSL